MECVRTCSSLFSDHLHQVWDRGYAVSFVISCKMSIICLYLLSVIITNWIINSRFRFYLSNGVSFTDLWFLGAELRVMKGVYIFGTFLSIDQAVS